MSSFVPNQATQFPPLKADSGAIKEQRAPLARLSLILNSRKSINTSVNSQVSKILGKMHSKQRGAKLATLKTNQSHQLLNTIMSEEARSKCSDDSSSEENADEFRRAEPTMGENYS